MSWHRIADLARRPMLMAGLCIASLAATGAGLPLERVPLPPEARLQVVSHDIVQNGLRMSVATFVSSSTVADTLAWYRAQWPADEQGPGHVEATSGDWQIVSRLQHGNNIALQLKPSANAGSQGLLSVMPLAGSTGPTDAPPMPPGSRLLSDTRSRGLAGMAMTQLLQVPGGAADIASFYSDLFEQEGWTLGQSAEQGGAVTLLFTSASGRMDIVASPHVDGGTLVVLNRVTREQ